MAQPGRKQRERERRQRRNDRRAEQRAQGAAADARGAEQPSQSSADPIRGSTAPTIYTGMSWHLARTKPLLGPLGRQRLDKALTRLLVPAYRPRVSEVVVRRGRRVVRHVPLLIRTLIVGVDDEDHLGRVAALPGIAEIVSHPEAEGNAEGNVAGVVMRPARLDPEVLQAFMIRLAANEVVQPVGIAVGDHVVVVDGSFASFPAVVTEILPNDRIRVEIAIFGRATSALLDIAQVQPA